MLTTEKKPKNDPKLGRFEKPRFEDLTIFLEKYDQKNPFFGNFSDKTARFAGFDNFSAF